MRIVCLGDSCTYGQNVRADEAWPAVLAQITGHDVRNEGVCGDTTRLGLERWKYAVGLHKPDVVVVQFGHNDANTWDGDVRVSLDAYLANLMEMGSRVVNDKHPEGVMFACSPHECPDHPDKNYQDRVKEYRKAQDECFGVLQEIEVSLLDDGYFVHPDKAMHRRYAEALAEALECL